MLLTVLLSPPAKRYLIRSDELDSLSKSFDTLSVGQALQWTHSHIRYQGAPFTDNALDTYQRRRATCGGMSNILHKLLLLQNYDARIVHLRNENRIHTAVEYYDNELKSWILIDPQYGLDGRNYSNIIMLKLSRQFERKVFIPEQWRGFTAFYVDKAGYGYEAMKLIDYEEPG